MPESETHSRHSIATCGVCDFLPGIDLVYWWRADTRRAQLDCVAVLRIVNAARWCSAPEPDRLRGPEGLGPSGGGATMGPFHLMFDETHRELWVDHERVLTLQAANVVLLTDVSGSLKVVGTDLIDDDFDGPAPVMLADGASEVSEEYMRWLASTHVHLSERLQSSRAARTFLSS